MRYVGQTALVTGASSGIGAEFAARVAAMGADVVLVGRRQDALESLAAKIAADTGRRSITMPLDLAGEGAAHELNARLNQLGVRVDILINCAGVGLTQDFVASTADEITQQIRLNAVALTEVTHEFLPAMLDSGRGTVVNVASLTGYMPVPGMAVYAASKSYVIRFTEALTHEVRGSGVTVLALSPGPTRTRFFERSNTGTSGAQFETPEQVVSTALRALGRRRPPVSVISGWRNRLLRRVVAVLPTRLALAAAESRPAT